MISDDNRKYLMEIFNIDIAKYSNDELNVILDEIIKTLNNAIDSKINYIKSIKSEHNNN